MLSILDGEDFGIAKMEDVVQVELDNRTSKKLDFKSSEHWISITNNSTSSQSISKGEEKIIKVEYVFTHPLRTSRLEHTVSLLRVYQV